MSLDLLLSTQSASLKKTQINCKRLHFNGYFMTRVCLKIINFNSPFLLLKQGLTKDRNKVTVSG